MGSGEFDVQIWTDEGEIQFETLRNALGCADE
jgi:hypothetical protein